MQFRLRTLLALFPAAAVFLTVGPRSGYWCSAGILTAALLLIWAFRSKKRGWLLLIRTVIGLVAAVAIWFLAVDKSEFVEGCPDCGSGRFITQLRLLGCPLTTDVYETKSIIDDALADLGAPCQHRNLWREHTHRFWGLFVCGCPCFDATWGLGGSGYSGYVSRLIRERGKADPDFAAEMHRRVIDQDDKKYFWEALMTDVLAPERIVARNTREALTWLQGSTED